MALRARDIFRTRIGQATAIRVADRLHQANLLIKDGQLEAAAPILQDLIASDPANVEAWYKQGNVLRALNRLPDALASYQRAITLNPQYTAALCNRSVVLLALGQPSEALRGLEQAIEIDPEDAIAHYNRGVAEQSLGHVQAAFASLDKAIELNPHYAEAYFCRGRMHAEAGRWQQALSDFDSALSISPRLPQGQFYRGTALAQLKQWNAALASFDLAVLSEPQDAAAHLNRGNVLRQLRRWGEAFESYERVISLQPEQVDGHFNRAVLLEQLKRFPEAMAGFDRAVAIDPQFAPAQYNRALMSLATGDLVNGFKDYEWRWKNRATSFDPAKYHGDTPLWFGRESLAGRTILVFSEQGLGDSLQFCRYLKLLAERGATVIFEVQQPLVDLLASVDGASRVITRGDVAPKCDYKCALMTLPLAFQTTLENIPSADKYIHIDAERVSRWQSRLGPRTRPRIGLVWSGNAQYLNDEQRSMSLKTLVEHLPREFDYFCLQKDIREEDRATLNANPFIVDYTPDFVDTAALCECMDLVISVCTSVAHLAGALGRPVWVLLAYNADWRWLEERSDSPWYPSAKLFRQETMGNWGQLAARVGDALHRKFSS